MITELENALIKNQADFHPVVDFDPATEKLYRLDFTDSNTVLGASEIADTRLFDDYINRTLKTHKAKYGIGGYKENRTLYRRSELFAGEEARSLHLGIDIWGPAGTPVYAALGGMVHSFAYNDNFGDYGATIILLHQLETVAFHTLYGHLSLADISTLHEGAYINRGQVIGHFGEPAENGNWPPHLHFQIIQNIYLKEGDYPGVCKLSEAEQYISNSPDPDLILNLTRHIKNLN
ncbi:MAG: peptidoglycan DD-metalloendopeptidase family protein [Ferruginibacter sp.]|nr:peptidoglycan DD-metalloendopeptidase family protein [Chitinophagaceae bacterium]